MSSVLMIVAAGLAVANLAMLVAVTAVWARNYRTLRTPLTLGLSGFGVALAAENAAAVYLYLGMHARYGGDPLVDVVLVGMRAVQFLGLTLLAYVSLR